MTHQPNEELRDHLERVAAMIEEHQPRRSGELKHASYERLVLDLGRPYEAGPTPEWLRPGELKRCYANAFITMLTHRAERGLRYCEGYYLPGDPDGFLGIPTLHAWVVQAVRRSTIALVWTPAEQIRRHVTVRAEHPEVIAFRLPQEASVEVCALIPVDAEGSTVGGAIAVDVVDSEKLEGLLATAGALPAVQLEDLNPSAATALGIGPSSGRPVGVRISLSALLGIEPRRLQAVEATDPAIHGWLDPAVVAEAARSCGSGPRTIAGSTFVTGLERRGWRSGTGVLRTLVWHPNIVQERVGMLRAHAEDRVIEPTWPHPEWTAYYGMPFAWEDVRRFSMTYRSGILAGEYVIGHPLLTTGRLFPDGWKIGGRRTRPPARTASDHP